MSYKSEKNVKIEKKLESKYKMLPSFIIDYFDTLNSPVTRNCNFGQIKSLFDFLIEQDIIRSNMNEITPDDLQMVKTKDIAKYLDSLKQKGEQPGSILTKRAIFSGLWHYLAMNNYVDSNIVLHINKNRFKESKSNLAKFHAANEEMTNGKNAIKLPADDQIYNFIVALAKGNKNHFDTYRNFCIVMLLLTTGIRSEELIGLDVSSLKLGGKHPYIEIIGKGKTVEDGVNIYFDRSGMIKIIGNYLDLRERYLSGKDENALFVSNRLQRLSKTSIRSFFDRYSNNTITPHMLRHWHGTKLYQSTKDLILVQNQMRHSDPKTTAVYYVFQGRDPDVEKQDMKKLIRSFTVL